MAKLKFIKYKKEKEKVPPKTQEQPAAVKKTANANQEEIAAVISMALRMYLQDAHDYERAVVTIQKVMRPYSPWSSKIYGLRQIPFRFPRQLK